MAESQVKTIRALARGLDVLQLLQRSGAMRLQDLHRETGLPKASLLRILKTLMEQGVVWQRMVDGAYLPSHSLAELAGRMDREGALVETAGPVLARLTETIEWPSVLAVPRLTSMEVLETNVTRSYFDHIAVGPVGYQVNILRSASGRAFLSFCEEATRAAMLDALRRSVRKGDRVAHSPAYIDRVLAETRAQGFALRDPDFGGDYDEGRDAVDDGRDSIAVPIRLGSHVPATINITWSKRAYLRDEAVPRLAAPALAAAAEIAARFSG
ncbi:helix-turn-helix domain-containing protein [Maritimibacter sp. DP1N21-5]|uniref:helix-turn-helix domain-containing protein n=1 Tax=Maritimibacter sp. DP1N21-5 TaxID=2836867 RepID=UPI001C49089D|nr:helix-turn-helix domain-containing protein [Maritimibacter sp. DP1N21-5]MBV7410661.1 helix-turn-helix domain-containing protein [Maritimibacter sp. DP1N21-5]